MGENSTDWADRTVLITGGHGLLGSALAAELKASGYTSVVRAGRSDADLSDPGAAEQLFSRVRPALVFHLAGKVQGILGNLHTQADTFLANIRINTNVIEAARRAGAAKIVAMGSTAIYSDQVPRPMREDDIWLGAPHGSEAGYAHAKRAMLAQLEAYRDQYGVDYAFAVATNMYGPHDRFDERFGHVIPSLLSKFERSVRTGKPVEVWGSGAPRRDFLFVADAARALRLVAERFSGSINLATGKTVSIAEVVDTLVRVSGFAGQVVWDRSKPDGQMLRDYDVSRLASLGFSTASDLEAGLGQTLAWLRVHPASQRRR